MDICRRVQASCFSLYTRETQPSLRKLSRNVICDEYRNHPSVCIPHFYNVRESGEFTHVILEICHRVDRLSGFLPPSSTSLLFSHLTSADIPITLVNTTLIDTQVVLELMSWHPCADVREKNISL